LPTPFRISYTAFPATVSRHRLPVLPEKACRLRPNVIWSLFNLAATYLLFQAGRVFGGGEAAHLVFFAGIAAISVPSSIRFAGKHNLG